jgi:hypothetical protein
MAISPVAVADNVSRSPVTEFSTVVTVRERKMKLFSNPSWDTAF